MKPESNPVNVNTKFNDFFFHKLLRWKKRLLREFERNCRVGYREEQWFDPLAHPFLCWKSETERESALFSLGNYSWEEKRVSAGFWGSIFLKHQKCLAERKPQLALFPKDASFTIFRPTRWYPDKREPDFFLPDPTGT